MRERVAGPAGFEVANPPLREDFPRSQAPQAYAPFHPGSAPFQETNPG